MPISWNSLTRKTSSHSGEKMYKCLFKCRETFYTKEDWATHIVSDSVESPYQCSHCKRYFRCLPHLKSHSRVIHGKIMEHAHLDLKPRDDTQNRETSITEDSSTRTLSHTAEMPRVCTPCRRTFSRMSDLNHHLLTTHSRERQYKCPFQCEETFLSIEDWKSHILLPHLGSKSLPCPYCQSSFKCPLDLTTHLQTVHSRGRNHRNSYSDEGPPHSTEDLSSRSLVHWRTNLYACPYCSITVNLLQQLITHVQVAHPEKQHNCPQCKRTFITASDMKGHVCSSTGSKLYECELYQETISTGKECKTQKAFHSKENVQTCPQCKTTFKSLSELETHVQLNHPEELSECPWCEVFCNSTDLKDHICISTGGEQYQHNRHQEKFLSVKGFKTPVLLNSGERLHTCSQCKGSFGCMSDLTAHLHTAHSRKRKYSHEEISITSEDLKPRMFSDLKENSHTSPNCSTVFRALPEMETHVQTTRSEELHKCCWCEKVFTSTADMEDHVCVITESSTSCDQHQEGFFNKEDLGVHTPFQSGEMSQLHPSSTTKQLIDLEKHTEVPIKCAKCEKTFNNETNMKDHMCSKAEVLYEGDQFGDTFHDMGECQRHSLANSRERPHGCSQCDKSFTSLSDLEAHTQVVYSGEEIQYKCPQCEKAFSNKTNMENHSCINAAKHLYKCSLSQKQFLNIEDGQQHVQAHAEGKTHAQVVHSGEEAAHKNSRSEESFKSKNSGNRSCINIEVIGYKCSHCQETFPNIGDWQRHVLIHSEGIAHKCSQCGKAFNFLSDLETHVQIVHSGEGTQYKCPHCEKSLSNKTGVEDHFCIKKDTLVCECSRCKKTFLTMADLQRHVLLHSEETTQRCSQCGMSFSCLSDLETHTQVVHSGEEISRKCPRCEMSFSNETNLEEHLCIKIEKNAYYCRQCQETYFNFGDWQRHFLAHLEEGTNQRS